MRSSLRLLASLKPSTQYLTPGNPTGLTGLLTHPAPRSTLIYLYSRTLDLLAHLPPSSAYRASTESLTKSRLAIVEAIKPAGYDAWAARAAATLKAHPDVFATADGAVAYDDGRHVHRHFHGRQFVVTRAETQLDDRDLEWDGEALRPDAGPMARSGMEELGRERPGREEKTVEWVGEPALDARQVEEMETAIGGGLIEEVIQVAEGELKLVSTMVEHKVWDELQDKAPENQWNYFSRDQHVGETNSPPHAV